MRRAISSWLEQDATICATIDVSYIVAKELKMKMAKMVSTCKAIRTWRLTRSIGQGVLSSGYIAWWLGQSKSQTYRDLLKLEAMGLVERTKHDYKNTICYSWFLTGEGEGFLQSAKGMLYE